MVLRLRGYGAWIESDGRPLEEHAVEVTGNVISCYVCSEEGMSFTLHFDDDGDRLEDTPYGRSVFIWMDGQLTVVETGRPLQTVVSEGVRTRCYRFASAVTTDDREAAPVVDPRKASVGTIRAVVHRIRHRYDVPTGLNASTETDVNPGPVHRDSKQAGMHRIVLGSPTVEVDARDQRSTVDSDPFVTFDFLYLPRGALEARLAARHPQNNPPGPSVNVAGDRNKRQTTKRKREADVTSGEGSSQVNVEVRNQSQPEDDSKRPKRRVPGRKGGTKKPPAPDDIVDLT